MYPVPTNSRSVVGCLSARVLLVLVFLSLPVDLDLSLWCGNRIGRSRFLLNESWCFGGFSVDPWLNERMRGWLVGWMDVGGRGGRALRDFPVEGGGGARPGRLE